MRFILFSILCLLSACDPSSNQSSLDGSYANGELLGSRTVNVCWRVGDERSQEHMKLVESTVTSEFARAGITFAGWSECPPDAASPAWVVLAVEDARPYGRFGCKSTPEGACVQLNFAFYDWPDICDLEDWDVAWGCYCYDEEHRGVCIQTYALHEFAHVAGLTHEADHEDSTCTDTGERYIGAKNVGDYDPLSITNYCDNKRVIEAKIAPKLSDGDLATLQQIYSAPQVSKRSAK